MTDLTPEGAEVFCVHCLLIGSKTKSLVRKPLSWGGGLRNVGRRTISQIFEMNL